METCLASVCAYVDLWEGGKRIDRLNREGRWSRRQRRAHKLTVSAQTSGLWTKKTQKDIQQVSVFKCQALGYL